MALYEAHIDYTYAGGGPGSTTLFAIGTDELEGAHDQAHADAWQALVAGFRAALAPQAWSGCALTMRSVVIARRQSDGVALREYGVATASSNGGAPGAPLPLMSSLVVGWKTALPSRRGRGRSWMPPTVEDSNDVDGSPSAGYIGAHQTAADAFIAASVADLTLDFVVWHRPTGAVPPDGGFEAVTSAAIRDKWGSLRSRRD